MATDACHRCGAGPLYPRTAWITPGTAAAWHLPTCVHLLCRQCVSKGRCPCPSGQLFDPRRYLAHDACIACDGAVKSLRRHPLCEECATAAAQALWSTSCKGPVHAPISVRSTLSARTRDSARLAGWLDGTALGDSCHFPGGLIARCLEMVRRRCNPLLVWQNMTVMRPRTAVERLGSDDALTAAQRDEATRTRHDVAPVTKTLERLRKAVDPVTLAVPYTHVADHVPVAHLSALVTAGKVRVVVPDCHAPPLLWLPPTRLAAAMPDGYAKLVAMSQ
jgi:hypothetical protein